MGNQRAAAGKVRAERMVTLEREKGWLHSEKMARRAMEVRSLSSSNSKDFFYFFWFTVLGLKIRVLGTLIVCC